MRSTSKYFFPVFVPALTAVILIPAFQLSSIVVSEISSSGRRGYGLRVRTDEVYYRTREVKNLTLREY